MYLGSGLLHVILLWNHHHVVKGEQTTAESLLFEAKGNLMSSLHWSHPLDGRGGADNS
jgi:hypothetical protein